jgi:hypothetical protein
LNFRSMRKVVAATTGARGFFSSKKSNSGSFSPSKQDSGKESSNHGSSNAMLRSDETKADLNAEFEKNANKSLSSSSGNGSSADYDSDDGEALTRNRGSRNSLTTTPSSYVSSDSDNNNNNNNNNLSRDSVSRDSVSSTPPTLGVGEASILVVVTVIGQGITLNIDASPSWTVTQFKKFIAHELNIVDSLKGQYQTLKLVYGGAGMQLQGGRTLKACGINDRTGLQLQLPANCLPQNLNNDTSYI